MICVTQMIRLIHTVKRTMYFAATATLLLAGTVEVCADDADIAAACRRYLAAEGDEQKMLESRITSFDGAVGPIIKVLSRSLASGRQDVSGVLPNQTFTDPELKQAYSEDRLHFFVPDAYATPEQFGLLIFMHGGGRTTPREFPVHVVTHPDDDPKSYGLQPYFKDLPFIIVAPSAPWNEKTGARWNVPQADDYVAAVIQECRYRFNIDEDRVVLGGYSMGGFGAYHLCQRLSDRLAGGVVFSGAWKTTHWKAWTGLPLFIRHGAADAAAPGVDGVSSRPRFTDVFYARAAHQRLRKLAVRHVYVEDAGGHSIRDATDSLPKLARWIKKQRRDPFAPHVVAISPRGWKASTDTPTPHTRWVTIHQIGTENISFDGVVLDGPSPKFNETREAFDKQTFRLDTRRVEAGVVDAKIECKNRIVILTENVRRFSIWLHPSMIDFSKPVHVSVNGKESEHDVQGRLLDALRSYQRRRDWGLIYHAEIMLTCDE